MGYQSWTAFRLGLEVELTSPLLGLLLSNGRSGFLSLRNHMSQFLSLNLFTYVNVESFYVSLKSPK